MRESPFHELLELEEKKLLLFKKKYYLGSKLVEGRLIFEDINHNELLGTSLSQVCEHMKMPLHRKVPYLELHLSFGVLGSGILVCY